MDRPRANPPLPRSTGPELVMTKLSALNVSDNTSRNRAGMLVRTLAVNGILKNAPKHATPGKHIPQFTTIYHFVGKLYPRSIWLSRQNNEQKGEFFRCFLRG